MENENKRSVNQGVIFYLEFLRRKWYNKREYKEVFT